MSTTGAETFPWAEYGTAARVIEVKFPVPGEARFEVVPGLDKHGRPTTISIPPPASWPPNDVASWRRSHPWAPDGLSAEYAEAAREVVADVAVLRLASPAPTGTYAFELSDITAAGIDFGVGTPVHQSGYGATLYRPRARPEVLNTPGPAGSLTSTTLLDSTGYVYSARYFDDPGRRAEATLFAPGFGNATTTGHNTVGFSGSPIWTRDHEGKPILLGMHSGGYRAVDLFGNSYTPSAGLLPPTQPLLLQQSFEDHVLLPNNSPYPSYPTGQQVETSDLTIMLTMDGPVRQWLREILEQTQRR